MYPCLNCKGIFPGMLITVKIISLYVEVCVILIILLVETKGLTDVFTDIFTDI